MDGMSGGASRALHNTLGGLLFPRPPSCHRSPPRQRTQHGCLEVQLSCEAKMLPKDTEVALEALRKLQTDRVQEANPRAP